MERFTIFSWGNSLFLWPFSIAMLVITRGYMVLWCVNAVVKKCCLNGGWHGFLWHGLCWKKLLKHDTSNVNGVKYCWNISEQIGIRCMWSSSRTSMLGCCLGFFTAGHWQVFWQHTQLVQYVWIYPGSRPWLENPPWNKHWAGQRGILIGVVNFSQIYLAKRTHIGKYCRILLLYHDFSVDILWWIQVADWQNIFGLHDLAGKVVCITLW